MMYDVITRNKLLSRLAVFLSGVGGVASGLSHVDVGASFSILQDHHAPFAHGATGVAQILHRLVWRATLPFTNTTKQHNFTLGLSDFAASSL